MTPTSFEAEGEDSTIPDAEPVSKSVADETAIAEEPLSTEPLPESEIREITLAFAGDINFDDIWCNTPHAAETKEGILRCYDNLPAGAGVL